MGEVGSVSECALRGSGGEGEHAVFLVREGVGRGRKGVSRERDWLVGDRSLEAGRVAGRLDRLRDQRRGGSAPCTGDVDRESGRKGTGRGKRRRAGFFLSL